MRCPERHRSRLFVGRAGWWCPYCGAMRRLKGGKWQFPKMLKEKSKAAKAKD